MKTIVSVSGGLSSAFVLKMAIEQYGKENVQAVFADVKGTAGSHFWLAPWFRPIAQLLHERFGGESRDTYRFIWKISHALDIDVERLEDGRSIWSVAGEKKALSLFVNKNKVCMASETLKRMMIADWIEGQGLKEGEYQIALGMGFFEDYRTVNARYWWKNRMGYDVIVVSPIADAYRTYKKIIDPCMMTDWLNAIDVDVPEAYRNEYPHNNCGGKCFLAGQTQWEMVYKDDLEGYLYAAWNEMLLHNVVGIDAYILKIERGGWREVSASSSSLMSSKPMKSTAKTLAADVRALLPCLQ